MPTEADFTITSQQSLITTATSVRQDADDLARQCGRAVLARRRNRRHEHHAGVRHRANSRNRVTKALGAPPAVIRRQFLVEASVLGFAGGILGAAIGIIGAIALPDVINNPIAISPTAIALAIVVAVAIGVIFGVYPASRAARLAPIDALRSE